MFDEAQNSRAMSASNQSEENKQVLEQHFSLFENLIILVSYVLFVFTFPLSIFCSLKVVQEYERAIVFRLGRILSGRSQGPGLIFVIHNAVDSAWGSTCIPYPRLPCIDSIIKTDMRTQTFNVPPQEVLTRDSVTVTVDAVVYIRIIDPTSSVVQVENAQFSTRVLASTTIRNIFGTKSLHEILSQREVIANLMQELLDEVTHKWGVSVERVEIKDVSLPQQMQRVMASEAEATREARSKLIAAQGEEKASRCLKEAAQTLADTPTAVQLRYLQTLNTISAETDSTLIFPIPIDITSSLMLSDYKSDDKNNYDDIAKTINEIERDFSVEPTLKHLSSVYLNEAKKYF